MSATEFPSDLEIAQAAKMRPIMDVALEAGLLEEELDLYGRYKAKVHFDEVLERLKDRPNGKYICVTAITPTPLGEGKTVTNIGLSQAIRRLGKNIVTTLRQPSMGPVFGIKGGAAGGGYSQVVPMEDLNLHFTGDIHAVGVAHNLLAAMLDNSLAKKNPLNIDPLTISWNRVVDLNERALRHIVIGLGGRDKGGIPRESGFDITVASEVMAILALATDLWDLRKRLSRIQVAFTYDGKPVTAEDLEAAGAMTVLLKDALKPNLIQTLEGGPVFMHAGPFANIAHGNNSVVADYVALKLGDYVVTESGFGADMGAEKLMNVKCRQSGLRVDAVVIVATVRGLKMHGGGFEAVPGKPIDKEKMMKENVPAVIEGCKNLQKHIENMKLFGVPVVVAINRFLFDTDAEVEAIRQKAIEAGADDAVPHEAVTKGGEGALELAQKVIEAADRPSEFKLLYPDDASIKEKIETIATKVYGAAGVSYDPIAEQKIKRFTEQGLDKLPINMAKTHLSLSHDPNLKNRPEGFTLPIRDIRPAAGAGFLYPLCGTMSTMPALPTRPAACAVDIDENGKTVGLF
jgi:formate--tetrahydrofolate ligase